MMMTMVVKYISFTDGYSEEHIKFKWEKDKTDGMSFVPGNAKMLPQYSLVSLNLSKISNRYVVGKSYFYNAFLLRMQWNGIFPPPSPPPPLLSSLLLLFEMGCWEERSDLHGTFST